MPLTEECMDYISGSRANGVSWSQITEELGLPVKPESLKRKYFGSLQKQKESPAPRPNGTPSVATRPAMPRSHAASIDAPQLPESLAKDWGEFRLQGRCIGVLSDIHLPYHDVSAVSAAVSHLETRNIDTILLNGDVVDFYQGSRFTRIPTKASIKKELEIANQFIGWLRGKFPDAEIIWKLGNHEERWTTYLAERAPEIFEIASNAWYEEVGATKYDVKIIGDQCRIFAGKLLILHGHELGRGTSTPVNPARTLALRAMESSLIGHFHRQSENSMSTVSGKSIVTMSTGCLCHMRPEYSRINQWSSGFAVVTVGSDGNYECELKKIISGRVY